MAATPTPIFTQAPVIGRATLTSPTAVTSRANITGTTGLTQLTPTSTNGKRVDWIRVQGKGTSSAGLVFVWLYDGTTSTVIDEIVLSAITGSTTLAAVKVDTNYSAAGFNLPPTYQLYISISVAQDVNVYAFGGDY